jgi:hypothetical protein
MCGHLPMRQAQAKTMLRFLERSPSHLTSHGRECLLSFSVRQEAPSSASPSPSPSPSNRTAELKSAPHLELFAFLRHWQIEVLCKHTKNKELYTLVTTHQFVGAPKVVWERVADTDLHTHDYFDSTFQPVTVELSTPQNPQPKEYVPHVLPILY